MDIEVSIGFEVISFNENGRDWWMVKSLLEEDRNSSDYSLESFPEDRVEGFLHIGEA